MRRFTIILSAALVALMGVVATAQGRMSLEDYAKLMKSNAQANAAMNKAIESGANADALPHIEILRDNFALLRPFWAQRKRTDALAIVADGLKRLDTMEEMIERLATAAPNAEVQAAAKEFGGNVCAACHKAYRDGNNQTGFKFKEGVF